MDTTEVAAQLGTTPRIFRQFLRSPISTFVAVGSGARYDFTSNDLPTLRRRFAEWQGAGKPKSPGTQKAKPMATAPVKVSTSKIDRLRTLDRAVWSEEESGEGIPKLEDIRDPRVRRRVQANARAAEDRLNLQLLAKGLHITQGRVDSRRRSA